MLYSHQEKGSHLMAAPLYRDEFEKRLEDLFVRCVDYTNSVLDVQRVKTVRQIVQEVGNNTDQKLAAQATAFQGVINNVVTIFRDEISHLREDTEKRLTEHERL